MALSILHIDHRRDLPDATNGIPCCMGYAVNGPGGCTCWEAIYELEQLPPTGQPRSSRTSMCEDCAYRKGSPERTGVDGYRGDEDELIDAVLSGQPFYCHQGVRKTIAYRHPSGMQIPAHPADYGWTKDLLKADGSPADICGGWCARRLKAIQRGETS